MGLDTRRLGCFRSTTAKENLSIINSKKPGILVIHVLNSPVRSLERNRNCIKDKLFNVRLIWLRVSFQVLVCEADLCVCLPRFSNKFWSFLEIIPVYTNRKRKQCNHPGRIVREKK